MLQSSIKKLKCNNLNQSKQQSPLSEYQTSETLTHISCMKNNIQAGKYLDVPTQKNDIQLLKYTLNHGNLDWLEQQLNIIEKKQKEITEDKNNQSNFSQCTQSLSMISDRVETTLGKIKDCRKTLQLSMIKHFMSQFKQKNQKNIRKANLIKYRQLLVTIKQKHQVFKNYYLQKQIIQLENQLKACRINFAPLLVKKLLINMVGKTIFQRKCIIQITQINYLRMIVDHFMNDNQTLMRFSQVNPISNIQHAFYARFKMYSLLKTYVCFRVKDSEEDNRMKTINRLQFVPNKRLNEMCQQIISEYYSVNIRSIQSAQLSKIGSLCQSNVQINTFVCRMINRHLHQLFDVVQQYKVVLAYRMQKIQQGLISGIYQFNKGFSKDKKLAASLPRSYLQFIQAPAWQGLFAIAGYSNLQNAQLFQGLISIQQIGQILELIQERAPILQNFGHQFSIKLTSEHLKQFVLIQAIKFLLNIGVKILLNFNKIQYKDKQQRNYHSIRVINLSIWKCLFGQQTNEKLDFIYQNIVQSKLVLKHQRLSLSNFGEDQNTRQNNRSQQKQKDKKQLMDNKMIKTDLSNKICISLAEFFIQIHELHGQVYLYLVNKLLSLLDSVNKNMKYSVILEWQDSKMLLMNSFIKIWIQIITEPVVQHLINQLQPANLLQNFSFLSDQVLAEVEQSHRIQNLVNNIDKQLGWRCDRTKEQKKQRKKSKNIEMSKKISFNEQFQGIYEKIMNVNLKTRNYNMLVSLCNRIQVYQQIKQMHYYFYNDTFKTLQF